MTEQETPRTQEGAFVYQEGVLQFAEAAEYAITPAPVEPGHIIFSSGTEEMLRITPEGVYVMGQLARDAGQVYNAMMRFLHRSGHWPWPVDIAPQVENLNQNIERGQNERQNCGNDCNV